MYSELFSLNADLLKAMAHPRRLEIIHLLRDQELPVTDIHTMLDLPQANISQHLMLLREVGILTSRREGKQIYYQLSDKKIIRACDLLRDFLIEKFEGTELAQQLTYKMNELLPLAQDPVCKMRVSPKTAGFHYKHQQQDYYFCASGCLSKFNKNPEKYAPS